MVKIIALEESLYGLIKSDHDRTGMIVFGESLLRKIIEEPIQDPEALSMLNMEPKKQNGRSAAYLQHDPSKKPRRLL